MKIYEIFSQRELDLMDPKKAKAVTKPSRKNSGLYVDLSDEEREKALADTKKKLRDPNRVGTPRFPDHTPDTYEQAKKEHDNMKKAAIQAHAEKQARRAALAAKQSEKDHSKTPEEKAKRKKANLDTDLKKLNTVKKSQPLPDNPENEKRKLPSDARRRNMDRYWAKYRD